MALIHDIFEWKLQQYQIGFHKDMDMCPKIDKSMGQILLNGPDLTSIEAYMIKMLIKQKKSLAKKEIENQKLKDMVEERDKQLQQMELQKQIDVKASNVVHATPTLVSATAATATSPVSAKTQSDTTDGSHTSQEPFVSKGRDDREMGARLFREAPTAHRSRDDTEMGWRQFR